MGALIDQYIVNCEAMRTHLCFISVGVATLTGGVSSFTGFKIKSFPHSHNNAVAPFRKHGREMRLAVTLNPEVMKASVSATVKLLSSIGFGTLYTPAGPKIFGNVLDAGAISTLSKLTFWVFQPCFLFTGVAGTLASAVGATGAGEAALSPQALFLLPVAALLQISIGALLATIYTSNNMGLRQTLLGIQSDDEETASDVRMCATFANSGPLPLIFADALFQARKGILTDVAACISFYLLVWSPLFWTLGRIILGTYNKTDDALQPKNVPSYSKLRKRLALVLSPPVVGSLLGLLVGSRATLRNLVFQPSGLLHPLFSATKSFGHAYLPAALLVLAGSLVGNTATANSTSINPTPSKIHKKTLVTLMFSRFVLAPLVALGTMRFLSILNVLPTSNPRSLAIVTYTILCEGCMPSAQNAVVMLQLDGKPNRAKKMAKLLTVMYTLATVPITILLSACLAMSGILKYN